MSNGAETRRKGALVLTGTASPKSPHLQVVVDIFFGQSLYSLTMVGGDNKGEYANPELFRRMKK